MERSEGNEIRSLVFASTIDDLAEVNGSFDRGVMRVAYHGSNRNGTFIDKVAFENAIPSMFNCPIVCHYNRGTDSIGGHDVDIIKTGNGMKTVNTTTPVGVVPESAKTWWCEVEEPDGEVHEYLCTEVLIWKRQEAYSHIKENGITDESMEIGVKDGFRSDDGYYHVTSFEFRAFCLLEGVSPCFESADVELFSLGDFKAQYSEMMKDIKREFSQVMTASADDIQQTFSKGGTDKLDVTELMQKYGLAAEDIDFETSDMSLEEIETRFAQIQEEKQTTPEDENNNPALEEAPEGAPEEEEHFSLTAEQFRCELRDALRAEKFVDPAWGELTRYWYVDHCCEDSEVYAYDNCDDYIYGFVYVLNGDRVTIDFASKKRKKTVYADFDEGEKKDATFSVKEVVDEFRAKFEERNTAEMETFAKFADLNGNEMFEELRGNCGRLTIEQIEEKCFAIRGRTTTVNFSLEGAGKAPRIPIERQSANKADEPYGGIFAKYNVGIR